MCFKTKKILLTGASGFIGAAILKNALLNGWSVRILTRHPNVWLPQKGLEIVEGDLVGTQDWRAVLLGVQVVVHAAGEIKSTNIMHLVNVEGPKQLLNAAVKAGVKRWVQLSSAGAYGIVKEGVVTEIWPDNPSGPYEETKANFDNLLKQTAISP